MIWTPLVDSSLVDDVSAMPPPTAWATSEMISAVMKMPVYQAGERKELCTP